MFTITQLENYVTTKGYYSADQLVNMQFEIGERVREGSPQWDNLYSEVLMNKVLEMDGNVDQLQAHVFNLEASLTEDNDWEPEQLREIGD